MQETFSDYAVWSLPGPSAVEPDAAEVRVAILLLPQSSAANIAAVSEDLRAVNTLAPLDPRRDRFHIRLVAEEAGPRPTFAGVTLTPDAGLDERPYDTVFVSTLLDDGCMSRLDYGPVASPAVCDWLRAQHAGGAAMTTMCSGAFVLAEAGLLDGHAAAVTPFYADTFRARYPKVGPISQRPLLVSGDRREIVTGGDSVYSADVSIYTIARSFGFDIALLFARLYGRIWTEALHEPDAAEPDDIDDRLVRLARQYILSHLTAPGVVGAAAEMVNLTPRTLARRFQRATGRDPRSFVTEMRMARARDLLTRSRMPIEDIAARLGYADRTSFAKRFRDRMGLPPVEFRQRFQRAARLSD